MMRRSEPAVGTLISDRYLLGNVRWRSPATVTYEATHRVLRDPMLVECLLDDDPEAQARFREGARLGSMFGSDRDAIVASTDFGQADDGGEYIVRVPSAGTPLAASGPLAPPRVFEIMRRLLHAVSLAHAQGIVLRMLAPETIIIEPDGRVRLYDFRYGKLVDSSGTVSSNGQVIDNGRYMSDEQSRGQPLDARADIYACGVIFYDLMTGTLGDRIDRSLLAPEVAAVVDHALAPLDQRDRSTGELARRIPVSH